MKNIKIIKTGINVSKIKKQLEKYPEDWGSQKKLENVKLKDPHEYITSVDVLQLVMGGITTPGEEVGNTEICTKTPKSRLSKENKEVQVRLYFDDRGLDRYYGLLELGEIGGIWKNVAGRYEINGKKVYGKQILANPDEYFTPEVLQALDEIAQKEFSYGS